MSSCMVVEHFFPGAKDTIYEHFNSKDRSLLNDASYRDVMCQRIYLKNESNL